MKPSRLAVGIAATTLLLGAAGTASAGPEPSSKPSASSTNSIAEGTALLRNLAGEWEGSIQTRNPDGTTSSSIASASNRVEKNGRAIASVYEGYAFGKATDGALALTVQSSGQVATAFSRDGNSLKANASVANNALSASFEKNLPGFKAAKTEQVLKMTDANHYTLELFSVDAAGAKTLSLRLDLARMDPGQSSAAAESFASSKSLAIARSATESSNPNGHEAPVQTAGVETP